MTFFFSFDSIEKTTRRDSNGGKKKITDININNGNGRRFVLSLPVVCFI